MEVSEKKLNNEEKEKISAVKWVEVKDWLAEKVVAKLPAHLRPKPGEVMKTRWVLTWKADGAGGNKAKARLVVLGFQDPSLGEEAVNSPTLSRRGRNMIFQLAACRRWRLWKADVKAAFLQGQGLEGKPKFILPVPELAKAVGVPDGTPLQLTKAAYGLCQAPKAWYDAVNHLLVELGGRQSLADPCVWVFQKNGRSIGVVGTHVDDFLITGDESSKEWRQIIKKRSKEGFVGHSGSETPSGRLVLK